jgi:hypothetical protein
MIKLHLNADVPPMVAAKRRRRRYCSDDRGLARAMCAAKMDRLISEDAYGEFRLSRSYRCQPGRLRAHYDLARFAR